MDAAFATFRLDSLNRSGEMFYSPDEISKALWHHTDVLGVSRQRVSELRGRSGFPRPAAELAAGPVWRLSSLQRFVSDWPRRPGRPATREARFKELELLAERAVSDEDDSMIRGRGLTSREREVLALIAEGRSLTEIAELLGLKGKTLDSHMRSVVAKFRASGDPERSMA